MSKVIETDVLVIGSGLAGLLATIRLLESGKKIVLVCKTGLAESNSRYAQGGIAAAAPASSSSSRSPIIPGGTAPIEAHLADTIKSGAGLVNESVAREIVSNGWRLIELLRDYGVVFDHLPDGSYALAREGGHSAARVYHHQDVTGTWICNALIERLKSFDNLQVFEQTFACDLIVKEGICSGARAVKVDESGQSEILTISAENTILATGGVGQVYSRTTNPAIATGDGMAMAYNAGAELIDMEFMQFHPTALHLPGFTGGTVVLISEAVRGAGALLLDHKKERFMPAYDPSAELATRDIVTRSMCDVMQKTASDVIFLDLRPIGEEALKENFPNILLQLKQHGIDGTKELVPVSPAAHYFMGGIRTDSGGKTSIPGLYAVGECASTGLHGANRLASNSLLEAGVMALNVADLIDVDKKQSGYGNGASDSAGLSPLVVPSQLPALRELMFSKVGVVRSELSLRNAILALDNDVSKTKYSVAAAEAAHILLLAKLITQSASRRQESRGAHYRSDYPQLQDKFTMRQVVYNQGTEHLHKWIDNKDLCPSSP